jgi:NSS family neurotransmitter:Na+ symporter
MRWNRSLTLIGMVVVAAGLSLVYCTRGGLVWIGGMADMIDGPWGIALLGLLECVVLGWMYRISRLRAHANERSDWRLGAWWDWLIRVVVPVVLSALFIWSLYETVTNAGFWRDGEGDLVLPNVIGVIVAGIAPVLAVLLSLIRSPGGGQHAAHVGEGVGWRASGVVGTVFALAAVVLICVGFSHTCLVKQHYNDQAGLAETGWQALHLARPILVFALVAAAIGLVLGAAGVVRCEATSRRPSRWARAAASISVLGVGASSGLLLALWVMARQLDKPKAGIEYGQTLSLTAYAIIGVMLALLLGGLLWCFYRALKAAGRGTPEQVPEGTEQ